MTYANPALSSAPLVQVYVTIDGAESLGYVGTLDDAERAADTFEGLGHVVRIVGGMRAFAVEHGMDGERFDRATEALRTPEYATERAALLRAVVS